LKQYGRFNHYLAFNKGKESPSNILILDTEANIVKDKTGENQTFRLGYAIKLNRQHAREKWSETGYELNSIEDLHRILDCFVINNPKKRLYVIAHNMAYDYAILKLDTYISTRHFEIKMRVITPVFIVKTENVIFLSSTNFFSESLKELGTTFGLDKMDSPNFENCTDEELKPYNKRDTEVLSNVIKYYIEFLKENDLGCFKLTIAAQALTAFRHRFMHTNLLIHTYVEILEMERGSYRGGRNETFRFDKSDNIYELDVNSMYPYVMKENLFPTMPIHSLPIYNPSIEDVKECISKGFFVLADCDLNLKKAVVATKREKLLFPIGKFKQIILNPEIEYILDNPDSGQIVKVNRMVCYKQEKIFQEYVDFFYNLRQNTTNETIQYMCKKFLNTLYGKFGQRKPGETILVTDEHLRQFWFKVMDECKTFKIDTKIKIGNDLYFLEKPLDEYSKDSMPIIASAVTAFARMVLFKLMIIAHRENVFYCDTDSLFVNQNGYDNLFKSGEIDSKILGKMKCKKCATAKMWGNKDYEYDGKIKIKGIKRDAEKQLDGRYIQKQFQTKNSKYIKGIPDGIVRVEYVTKKLTREYDKGIVENDRTSPFIFNEF
jgi:hypothetical protein